jgi:hypothetical protein
MANTLHTGLGSELSKVYALLEHWHHHQEVVPVDLIEYLSLHFNDQEHPQQDTEKHKKLPFQSHLLQLHNSPIYFVYFSSLLDLLLDFLYQGILHFFTYQVAFFYEHTTIIWQPPKL